MSRKHCTLLLHTVSINRIFTLHPEILLVLCNQYYFQVYEVSFLTDSNNVQDISLNYLTSTIFIFWFLYRIIIHMIIFKQSIGITYVLTFIPFQVKVNLTLCPTKYHVIIQNPLLN